MVKMANALMLTAVGDQAAALETIAPDEHQRRPGGGGPGVERAQHR